MENKALGIIEVVGLTLAIEVLDCALKSANVNFYKMEKIGSGIITVMIIGDVASVKAATEAGCSAGEKIGTIRAFNVIARPVSSIYKMFDIKKSISKEKITNKVNKGDLQLKIDKPLISYKTPNSKQIADKKVNNMSFDKMSVSDLRKLARELKLTNITKSEIKFAKRKQLIEKISEFREDN